MIRKRVDGMAIRLMHMILALFLAAAVAGGAHAQSAQTSEDATAPAQTESAEQAPQDAPAKEESPDLGAVANPDIDAKDLAILLVPLTEAELAELAATWQANVQAKTEELAEQQVKNAKAGDAATDADREKVLQLTDERNALFGKYNTVIAAWELKGGDAAEIAKYRAYRNAIIFEEVRTSDVKALFDRAVDWFTDPEGGIALATRIIVVVVALYALLVVARVVRAAVRRRIDRVPNLSKLLQMFLVTVVYWLVLSFGLMMLLAFLGINITPLFALVGGASFIVGFALQDTLANLANGLMIMINRPFDEGDFVDLSGVSGTVKSVSIVATTVVTPDNQVIVVPNKQVWGNTITNVTASDTRRVDLVFGIGYDDDIADAIKVLKEAVAAHELTLDDPEPMYVVGELGDNSVNIYCRPWAKTDDYWTVYWDLMGDVKVRFDAAGISIPYPQRDVHLHTVNPPDAQ